MWNFSPLYSYIIQQTGDENTQTYQVAGNLVLTTEFKT